MSYAHCNSLSPAEAERLAFLAEECAEVIMAVGKILRHGYESYNPDVDGHVGNRVALALEMGDVRAAMIMLCNAGDIEKSCVHGRADEKLETVRKWMHHQPSASASGGT